MMALTALLVAMTCASVAGAIIARAGVHRPVADQVELGVHSSHRVSWPRRTTASVVTPLALATWCDDLARSLRHGCTLRSSLVEVLPQDAAIERRTEPLRHWIGRGASVTDACDEWSEELAVTEEHRVELVAALAAVLAATASLGGNNAAPLDRFAATMRQRASDDLERGAQSAQAELSARVLTLVPVAILALLLATDAGVRNAISGPAGATVVMIGLALNVAGAAWMRRIIALPGGRA